MSSFDKQYIDLCRRIIKNGETIVNYKATEVENRSIPIPSHTSQVSSGAETIRLPHQMLQFDLSKEFPILTSKKVSFKSAVIEMLWIYQAASNDVRWLKERGVRIWDEWEISEDGMYRGRNFNEVFSRNHPDLPKENFAHTIGTAYGWIVKKYDLMKNLIYVLKHDSGNRRMVLSLWQNEWIETAVLPSCVWNTQWNLIDGRLNLLVTSRSSDVPLGLPFNVVQYAVLCHLIAQSVGAKPGLFTFITNDAHIYKDQLDGIEKQIDRFDKAVKHGSLPEAPKLWLNPKILDFYEFDNSPELEDIKLENYNHLGAIKMPVTE